jgi:phosphoribosylanthranilate isomerase
VFVKICGLTDRAALDAAVEAGADAVGLMFAESARQITPRAAYALCRDLPETVLRVAVLHHPDSGHVNSIVELFGPDWIQTDASDFSTLDVPDSIICVPVYREGPSIDAGSLPPRFFFDGRNSGSGEIADWEQASELAHGHELILAGGLNVDNIDEAIERVRPFGVDVSSGVESARGQKDPRRIREFVARVRALEKRCNDRRQ